MANHKSSEKRARQDIRRTEVNRARKSRVQSAVRKVTEAAETKNYKGGMEALKTAQSEMSRAVSRGAVPKKRAARKMSRLSARLKKVK